jgi:hypothetical protein
MAWSTLLESHDFHDWQASVQQLLGPHTSRIVDGPANRTFRHRIRSAKAGPASLVEFCGGGSFVLERIQADDRAVLWIPTCGVIQETVSGETLLPEPGMALWIRPGTPLTGLIGGACAGVSIIVPMNFLQFSEGEPWRVDRGAGPMLLNPFGRYRSASNVALLHIARDLVQAASSPGLAPPMPLLLDGLIQHLREWDRPDPWLHHPIPRAEQHCREAEDWMRRHLDQPFGIRDVADAIHVQERTLQVSFRSQRDVTPTEAIRRLRRWRQQSSSPPA